MLNIDLSMFPTLWVVLSILLDTQDANLEYVKLLQEEYNTYYTEKSRKYMVNLETKSVEIQNHMHDSVTQDFDRVSDLNDNGSTPPLYLVQPDLIMDIVDDFCLCLYNAVMYFLVLVDVVMHGWYLSLETLVCLQLILPLPWALVWLGADYSQKIH